MRFRSLVFCLACLAALPAFAATFAEADAWLKAKDARAAPAIAALVKAQPKSAEARILQARLLLQQGKGDDAVDAASEAVELAPGNAQAHYWLGNAYGTRIGQVGSVSQAFMAPKLRDAFEQAIALDPNLHDARTSLIEYYLQAPAMVGGSVDKARAQAAELAKRDPPRGHYARARLAMHDKQPDVAAKAYVAAWEARPESVTYRMAAGLALQETKQWDRAFGLYQGWTSEDPKAAAAWYQLGRTAALSGQRLDVGASALRRYLTLPLAPGQPERHYAWYRLGQVQALAGDSAAARASFKEALKGEPGNADFKAALAALPS
ncbi:MAG: tetratricopeptide repeat protein [Arenimonas sp.]|nr:tetratricopeptide repeat protein [Arenimonas sp.]